MFNPEELSQLTTPESMRDFLNRKFPRLIDGLVITETPTPDKLAEVMSELCDYERLLAACDNCPGVERCENHGLRPWLRPDLYCGRPHVGWDPCQRKRLAAEQSRAQQIVQASEMKPRHWTMTFDAFTTNDENQAAYDICLEFANRYPGPVKAPVLIGGVGTGKTHLAAAIVNRLLERSIAAMFVVVPELIAELRASFGQNGDMAGKMRVLKKCPVVRDVVRLITDDTLPVNGRLLLIHKVIHEELAKEVK